MSPCCSAGRPAAVPRSARGPRRPRRSPGPGAGRTRTPWCTWPRRSTWSGCGGSAPGRTSTAPGGCWTPPATAGVGQVRWTSRRRRRRPGSGAMVGEGAEARRIRTARRGTTPAARRSPSRWCWTTAGSSFDVEAGANAGARVHRRRTRVPKHATGRARSRESRRRGARNAGGGRRSGRTWCGGPATRSSSAGSSPRARAGRLAVVGTGAALIDTTYVDDAVDALVAALDRAPGLPGRVLVVSGGEPPGRLRSCWRRSAPPLAPGARELAVPARLARAGGAVAETPCSGATRP